MSNLASTLRDEISRLAKKETRSETEVLRRSSAQHRRDIAQLKRQVVGLTKRVALLEKAAWKSGAGAKVVDLENTRFSAKGLASHRQRLGLSGAEFAQLVGVSTQSLYNWEQGKTRPREEQMKAVIALRGLTKKEAWARLEQM